MRHVQVLAVDRQQPPADEGLHHPPPGRRRVVVEVQFVERQPPPDEGPAVVHVGQPHEQPARVLLVLLARAAYAVSALRVSAPDTPPAPR